MRVSLRLTFAIAAATTTMLSIGSFHTFARADGATSAPASPSAVPPVPAPATTPGPEPVPGAAATPVLTADPVVGLHELSFVDLNGSGFAPSSVIGTLAQCVSGGGGCDVRLARDLESDASGAVVAASFAVHRDITAGGDAVACDAAPGTCEVRVATWNFPITFSLPREEITFSSTSNLADGQEVTLFAANFAPYRWVMAHQCATPDGDPAHCWNVHPTMYGQVGPDGTRQLTGQVVRMLPTASGEVDCGIQTCYLASEDISFWDRRWIVPVTFAPVAPVTTTTTSPATGTGGRTLPRTGASSDLWIAGLISTGLGIALLRLRLATRPGTTPS